jgi:acyl-CoA dehydrogenase
MSQDAWPAEVDGLRQRTQGFISNVVMSHEPVSGEQMSAQTRDSLRQSPRDASVFVPHVPKECGGQGIPTRYWSPIFQEAGSPRSAPARSIAGSGRATCTCST